VTGVDVIVAGGGFSGSMLGLNLARAGVRAVVCDAPDAQGRGRAYSTPDDAHLLNVPAGGMSAFPDAPGNFVDWVRAQGIACEPTDFLPRRVYGMYLRALCSAARIPQSGRLKDVSRGATGWRAVTAEGEAIAAPVLVLAMGHRLPPCPGMLAGLAGVAADPYACDAFDGIPADAAVAVMGTGLTAADSILTLARRGHRGAIVSFSRSGRWPIEHRLGLAPHRLTRAAPQPTARAFVAWIRHEAGLARDAGADPRAVIDALRPLTPGLWGSLPWPERARLYRHARSLWDTTRHRMPPSVSAAIDAMMTTGQLVSVAARLVDAAAGEGGLTLTLRARSGPIRHLRGIARLILATGTETAPRRGGDGLLDRLWADGHVVPDPLRLGVMTDADGRCLSADGAPVPGLHAMGPLRRGTLWENTAVPELRVEAARLAQVLAQGIRR